MKNCAVILILAASVLAAGVATAAMPLASQTKAAKITRAHFQSTSAGNFQNNWNVSY
jgi:hypothetical protein